MSKLVYVDKKYFSVTKMYPDPRRATEVVLEISSEKVLPEEFYKELMKLISKFQYTENE